jgi:hypothetical protein
MERDTDLEKIWLGDRFIQRPVYPLYDLLIMSLYWEFGPSKGTIWNVKTCLEWAATYPTRVGY